MNRALPTTPVRHGAARPGALKPTLPRLDVLMLLNPEFLEVQTVRDYCEAFDLHSRHRVAFASCRPGWASGPVDYSKYDALLFHYVCPIRTPAVFDPAVAAEIQRYDGYKVLFVQDEYTLTECIRRWIDAAGIDHVFTCVPEQDVAAVFPPARFPAVTFTSCRTTGYVPAHLARYDDPVPLRDRPYHVVYRGRSLPYWFGSLGREKITIGKVVREACERRGVPVDIEWAEESRVYGRAWRRFLHSGRATLATETGCNVFDVDGSIERNVRAALRKNPDLAYEEVAGRAFVEDNLGVRMNQVSPKLFEFVAAGTALVLYEGEYSGLLRPGAHYLALRKDHSNLAEVLDALDDLPRLEAMTRRARAALIDGGENSYQAFVRQVDEQLDRGAVWSGSAAGRRGPLPAPAVEPPPVMDSLWPLAASQFATRHLKEELRLLEEKLPLEEKKKQNFVGMVARRRRKIARLRKQLESTGENPA